jgi:photosystem II stability/assembly factor-like uncharacterized protein
MNLENLPVCEHGIPAHALSNWRDGDQTASGSGDIATHLAECAASRARLAEYDVLVQALHAQRVPSADERLWEVVHMHINQTRTGAPTPARSTPRRLVGSLAALAAVLALLLGFALLLNFRSAPHRTISTTEQATATATSTPIITTSGWSQTSIPAGFTLSGPSLAIAPSDGNIAYACVTAEDAGQSLRQGYRANQIWVTHDRGVHWRRMTDPPGPPINQCFLYVDALDPEIVIAYGRSIPLYSTVPVGTPPTLMANGGGEFSAVTFDGGVTWQQPASFASSEIVGYFATSDGTTFAVRCCFSNPSSSLRLMVSRDSMRTWRPVDAAIVAAGQGVAAFFYRPDTGELLAMAYNANTVGGSLWESSDGGAHWTKLPPTPSANSWDIYVTQQPTPGHPWHLCVETYNAHNSGANLGPPTGIFCSDDGGHHWASRPLPEPLPSSFKLLGISNGGDLLAESGGSGADRLYRLPAGSNQWQMFDTAPGAGVSTTFVPSPGAGMLWVGTVPPSFYSPLDPRGRIYTKDYTP